MRNVYEVLREKQKCVEQVRRELDALRLTAQLLDETENPPANIATPGGDLETLYTEVGGASKISERLRRLAAPLLGTSSG